MDELAVTVSNILNQAAGGVGDISQWLTNNGLPGYAAVNTAQNAVMSVLALLLTLVFAVGGFLLFKRAARIENRGDDASGHIIFGSLVSVASFIALIFFCISVTYLAGWLASPDGMLLQTLVSAIKN